MSDDDAPDTEDAPEPDDATGTEVLHDCAAWAVETRGMLANLVSSAGIAHAWQGATLSVRPEDEDAVDDLVDEVLVASRPALDPSAEKAVYEVGQWPVGLLTELADALTAADVAYEWDQEGDLVVLVEDEEVVARVLDELPDPEEDEVASDDGVAVHEVLDDVFMAADRLARRQEDPAATVRIVDGADVLGAMAPPFGFEPPQWRALVDGVLGLRDAVAADEPDDAEIARLAGATRDALRTVV